MAGDLVGGFDGGRLPPLLCEKVMASFSFVGEPAPVDGRTTKATTLSLPHEIRNCRKETASENRVRRRGLVQVGNLMWTSPPTHSIRRN